jgi:hypothetical protein
MSMLEIHNYKGPSAEEVRKFCLMTGGAQLGGDLSGTDEWKITDKDAQEIAYGDIRFKHDSDRSTAKYALVRDRKRVHRYQQPGTNPHLLRFLLEDVWALPAPRLIIEVTGSAQGLVLNIDQRTDIMQSIMTAAEKMDGWVITGMCLSVDASFVCMFMSMFVYMYAFVLCVNVWFSHCDEI